MPKVSLDERISIGTVTKAEYEKDREERLASDELSVQSKYKLRLLGTHAISGKYALDFLCQIDAIKLMRYEDQEFHLTIFDRDSRPVVNTIWDVGLNGLIRLATQYRTAVPNSEAGYFLSAVDDWDLGLLSLAEQFPIEDNEVLPETVPLLV